MAALALRARRLPFSGWSPAPLVLLGLLLLGAGVLLRRRAASA